ncbi:MAG: hypothetical protein ACRDI0_01270 [Actinomycetota bacterium]
MIDLERQLRSTLMDRADTVAEPPDRGMPAPIRRRARRRQAATLGVAGVIVAVLATGGALTWVRVFPGPPPVVPIERPDDGTEERLLIASGVDGDIRWHVSVSRPSEEHVWCVNVETSGPETRWVTSACSPSTGAGDIDLLTAGVGKPFVYAGTVSDAVTSINFDAVRGSQGTARIVEVPEAGFRIFFVVVGKPGVVIFTARDADGDIVAVLGTGPTRN